MFLRASPLSAVVFTLPFALGACDPVNNDGRIANSPNQALAGCGLTALSCNPEGVSSGLVAKLVGDPDTGELVIRFVTLTKNEDGSFTYDDGEDEVDLVDEGGGVYSSTGSLLTLNEVLSESGALLTKLDSENSDIDGDVLFGFLGYHTDASEITNSATIATYSGTAEFALLASGLSGTGTSSLTVNFNAGDAELIALIDDGTITGFDKLVSSNMTVEGYSFTGNEISLYDGGLEVDLDDVVGADTNDAAAGMFFGNVDGDGYPVEYGAVAVVTGDDDKLLVLADGDLVP